MTGHYDVAVVGAGILGLAHAYHLARRGLRVVVLERHLRAQGASVRNFGLIWPIGQPDGPLYQLARRSREHWLKVLSSAGLWHECSGSLHLAYHEDEAQVLREFEELARREDRGCALWSPDRVLAQSPGVQPSGLQAGLWSPAELTVDPREVIAKLPEWLSRTYGVEFLFDSPVRGWDCGRVATASGDVRAERLLICTGSDFRELAPQAFAESGLILCKLQMLRTQAYGEQFRLGTVLAAGLTLRHYGSFAQCAGMPALGARLERDFPAHVRYGIHVMASQNGRGEIVLGDSHEYGDAIEPFDKPEIDALVLDYLRSFVTLPDFQIAARWHGIYAKHPAEAYVVRSLDDRTRAVTGVGGAGMTLSFGLAEHTVNEWLE